jgi:hypothetical protein
MSQGGEAGSDAIQVGRIAVRHGDAGAVGRRPQGSTIIERPWLARSSLWTPHWAGASTKAWFSMARARSSTSQWSLPVSRANALGTAIQRTPRSAMAR